MTQQFKAGDRVYSKNGVTAGYKIFTVGKVHKNGNFTLDAGTQQYRQSGHGCGHCAHVIYPLTDEILVELEAKKCAAQRYWDCRHASERLARMGWSVPVSEDQLARMLQLAAELLGK